jgi:hypothetical protein
MKMSAANVSKYPKFAKYVKSSMPTVATVPLIVKNMKTYGSLDKADFVKALKWGNEPEVLIKPLMAGQCLTGVAANGCFRPSDPTKLEIDQSRVEDFEKGSEDAKDVNSRKQKVFIVGTTLLHEMCHWGNNKAGVAETTEQGVAFEVKTYGRNTG